MKKDFYNSKKEVAMIFSEVGRVFFHRAEQFYRQSLCVGIGMRNPL